jgi:hypothetical protein
VLPGGQHGDHHVGARRRDLRGLGHRPAGRLEPVGRRGGDVHALDLVAGLEQVLRHRQAHIAEPDESDPCHEVLVGGMIRSPGERSDTRDGLAAHEGPGCRFAHPGYEIT